MYSYVLFGILMFLGLLTFILFILFCCIANNKMLPIQEHIEEETNNLINEAPQIKNFIPSEPISIPKRKLSIKD